MKREDRDTHAHGMQVLHEEKREDTSNEWEMKSNTVNRRLIIYRRLIISHSMNRYVPKRYGSKRIVIQRHE